VTGVATRLWRAPLPRTAGPGTCGLPGVCQRPSPAGGPTPHPQDRRIIANLPDGVLANHKHQNLGAILMFKVYRIRQEKSRRINTRLANGSSTFSINHFRRERIATRLGWLSATTTIPP